MNYQNCSRKTCKTCLHIKLSDREERDACGVKSTGQDDMVRWIQLPVTSNPSWCQSSKETWRRKCTCLYCCNCNYQAWGWSIVVVLGGGGVLRVRGVLHNWIFQQDNIPYHTARTSKTWMNDHEVQLRDWSPQSPDMRKYVLITKIAIFRKLRTMRVEDKKSVNVSLKTCQSIHLCIPVN